ncbi:MAG: class I mannose-6-phosphate isomerase [Planctomycetales bacterium]|nr:class I mannose-6-phosphate isomerase [Planctomycetales bacterium]
MELYPLKFRPIYKERIWGGQCLREVFGKDIPVHARIGESWELADLPDDKSEVANGPLKGQTLSRVLAAFGDAITGKPDYQPPFPLLIKFLDAQDNLSVQVHPDAQTCRRRGKGQPKTECWYIIDARPGAVIYKGLKPGTAKEKFARAIADGTCANYLVKVPVQAGECHFLPSGTCHAIGAGLFLAEIQQPSDTTYRVFDWNRLDPATGKKRQLHIEDALDSIHFGPSGEAATVQCVGRLVNADEFTMDKGHQTPTGEVLLTGRMKVLIILGGSGQIAGKAVAPVPFQKGDTLLIPAAFEGAMQFSEECHYLVVALR